MGECAQADLPTLLEAPLVSVHLQLRLSLTVPRFQRRIFVTQRTMRTSAQYFGGVELLTKWIRFVNALSTVSEATAGRFWAQRSTRQRSRCTRQSCRMLHVTRWIATTYVLFWTRAETQQAMQTPCISTCSTSRTGPTFRTLQLGNASTSSSRTQLQYSATLRSIGFFPWRQLRLSFHCSSYNY